MYIEVEGSAYDQGKAYGSKAKELIAKNIEVVKYIVTDQKNMDLDFYRTFVKKNADFIERDRPDTAEEMHGLADGSGIPYEDILLMNVQLFLHADLLTSDCSVVVAHGPATLDGKTYMGKNRDISYPMDHVVMRRKYDSGVIVSEVNPAGAVVWPGSGINSAGLSVATSGVVSPVVKQDLRPAAYSHVTVNPNYVLQACETVEDVIKFIKYETSHVFHVNFIAADEKRCVCIELTKNDMEIVESIDGMLIRSNHYHHPAMLRYNPTRKEYLSTYNRYRRAMSYLWGRHGEIRFQDILRIMSDHVGDGDGSLCRHGLPHKDGTTDGFTAYGSIAVVEDRQLWTALGSPCQAMVYTGLNGSCESDHAPMINAT